MSIIKYVLFATMFSRIASFAQQTGVVGFSYWQTGNQFEIGNGARLDKKYVSFSPAFSSIPKIVLSLKSLDSSHSYNLRVDTNSQGVTPVGFWLTINTWADTKLYGVTVSWTAYTN